MFTKPRAYNWSKPQRVAQKRNKYNWLLDPGAKAVADKAPAITSPKGKVLTPQGIKNNMPDNKEVPTQILNITSKIRIVIATSNKLFIFPRCALEIPESETTRDPEKS